MMKIEALYFALKVLFIAWILMIVWRRCQLRLFFWLAKQAGIRLIVGTVVPTDINGCQLESLIIAYGNIIVRTVSVRPIGTKKVIGGVIVPDKLDQEVMIGSRVIIQEKMTEGIKYADVLSIMTPYKRWWLPFPT